MRFLGLLAIVPTFVLSSLALASEPVELAFARYEVHYGRQPGQKLTGLIRVAHSLAPEHVAVHYSVNERDWQDVPATYQGLDKAEVNELWSFALPTTGLDGSRSYRLAIHADKGQEAFWDNNNWQDYRVDGRPYLIPSNPVVVLKQKPVVLEGAFAYSNEGKISGAIDVENLGPRKQVTVHYAVNGGPEQVADAHYVLSHTGGAYKTWRFDLKYDLDPELKGPTPVTFKVKVESDGRSYEDDNFGYLYEASSGAVKTLF